MSDAFTIHSSALPAAARLAGFHGSEGMSRLYQFDILLVMTNDVGHDFDLQGAVGARATLRLDQSGAGPSFVISGMFASLTLVSDFLGRTVYRAVLVPRFWHLTRSEHSRVFTQETIPAILASVLDQGGLAGAYSLRLLGSYPVQEHVTQYHESDFDFVSRWMEREGLYYFFEQDGEEERLVITDDKSTHHALGGPVHYFPQADTTLTQDRFRGFTCRAIALPASVRFKDYDYARPTFEVAGQAAVSPAGVARISIHGARFFTPDEGARLAQVKAQSLLSGEVVYQGSGSATNLRPGYTFELDDHPRAAFNRSYLTTELEHWVNQLPGTPEMEQLMTWDDAYRVEVTAIAAGVQFRAPQRTPWPRIYGGEHAVVDGPAVSDYAQIDSHGRYALKFHFDESDLSGGKASTWVRMLQPHGGGIEGFHFPLRVGTEVVCTFSGGDPDRPAIVGVAPNALTPSPVNAGNNTRNVIQTGGRNRFELEDKAGLERITLSTPHSNSYIRMGAPNADHTYHMHTNGSTLLDQGEDLDIQVGKDLTEYVVGTTTETYNGVTDIQHNAAVTKTLEATLTQTIKSDSTEEIFGKKTLTVHEDVEEFYQADRVMTVQGKYVTNVTKNSDTTTTGNFSNTIYGSNTTNVHGEASSYVRGKSEAKVDGELISIANGARVTTTQGLALNTVFGGSVSNVLLGSLTAVEGGALNVVEGARINITHPLQANFNFGTVFSGVLGLTAGLIKGGKYEEITGFKLEVVTGVNLKNTTLEALVTELNLETNRLKLSQEEVKLANRALSLDAADLSVTT